MAYIGNWLQSSYYSTLSYFLFDENGNEITRKMRLGSSDKDWFGTQQTLVLDKVWLKELTVKFEMILEYLKDKYSSDPEIVFNKWCEISLIEPNINAISLKLEALRKLLGDIFLLYVDPEMSEIFKYFFGCKRHGQCRNTCESFRSNSRFYTDIKKLILDDDLQKSLDEIFTENNCYKIQEMGIMFGFYPAVITSLS